MWEWLDVEAALMPTVAPIPLHSQSPACQAGREQSSILLPWPSSYSQSVALLRFRVTQPGYQAGRDAAGARLHPHLGFPAWGQWEPMSHLKEVLGPKQ